MKLEALFLRINRLFSITVALISLIVVFAFLIIVLKISINSPNLEIESPEVTYAEYKEQLNREFKSIKASAQTKVTPADPVQKAAAPKKRNTKYDDLTDKIYRNINTYANKVGAGTAKEDFLKDILIKIAADFDNQGANLGIAFLAELEAATSQMAADASYNLQFDMADTRRVDWEMFLGFFVKEYESRLMVELEQIQEEQSRIAGEKATIFDKLTIAGAVFVIFFLFTMMLALLKIEFNTRQVIARVEAK